MECLLTKVKRFVDGSKCYLTKVKRFVDIAGAPQECVPGGLDRCVCGVDGHGPGIPWTMTAAGPPDCSGKPKKLI